MSPIFSPVKGTQDFPALGSNEMYCVADVALPVARSTRREFDMGKGQDHDAGSMSEYQRGQRLRMKQGKDGQLLSQ